MIESRHAAAYETEKPADESRFFMAKSKLRKLISVVGGRTGRETRRGVK